VALTSRRLALDELLLLLPQAASITTKAICASVVRNRIKEPPLLSNRSCSVQQTALGDIYSNFERHRARLTGLYRIVTV
jgi:hypothetical protein